MAFTIILDSEMAQVVEILPMQDKDQSISWFLMTLPPVIQEASYK